MSVQDGGQWSTDVEPEAGTDGAATDDETTPARPAAEGAETDTGDAEVGSAEVDATADGGATDSAEADTLRILKCTGVVSIISFEGEPAAIPESEIDGIRRLVQSDLAYDPCPMIREGMMVEVVHGPLTGVVGRLVRKKDKARLVLSVDLIGQAVSVEVDAADVRPY